MISGIRLSGSDREESESNRSWVSREAVSRGARDSKIGKKWPESSRILDYILCLYDVSEV